MGSEEKEDGLYSITTSQQAICSCCGALITSVLGKSFLDSDGLTDHVYLYENGSGKTWQRTAGRFNGMMDAFVKIVQREGRNHCGVDCLHHSVSVPTTVIYFTCYDQLREAFISKLGEDNSYISLAAGGIARLFSATIISPVEMIRTTMQSRRLSYEQLRACVRNNVAQNGWLSLWKGWGPTVLRDVPFSALYWCNYESFKKILCKKSGIHEPTILITFSSGAAAGSIAATLTLPFDVVKTHKQTELLQLDVLHSSQKSKSIWEVMKRIVAENGFGGLFTGIIPRLTKIAPACAIMISTYEYGKSFFRKLNKKKNMENR